MPPSNRGYGKSRNYVYAYIGHVMITACHALPNLQVASTLIVICIREVQVTARTMGVIGTSPLMEMGRHPHPGTRWMGRGLVGKIHMVLPFGVYHCAAKPR